MSDEAKEEKMEEDHEEEDALDLFMASIDEELKSEVGREVGTCC
jgi:hypothetical protein